MARRPGSLLRHATTVALFLAAAATSPAAPPRFAGPGPTSISPEEAAIQADPAKGYSEAVVLLHEVELRDYSGKADADKGRDTRVHQRLKVLSNEFSRFLRIAYDRDVEGVVDWWARAIRPDGTVVELPRSAMKVVHDEVAGTALEGRFGELVPGVVLDWGWTLRQREYLVGAYGVQVTLPWPTRAYHLRWLPVRSGKATVLRTGLDPFPVEVRNAEPNLEAIGHDLPATEPLAEPGADAHLWIIYGRRSPAEHWTEVAREDDAANNLFLNRDGEIKKAIAELNLSASATLDQKLRAAYAFIEEEIQIAGLEEQQPLLRNDPGWSAGGVLRGRRAWAGDLSRLMVGFARLLGADATTLLVWNTSTRWDPDLPIFLTPAARLVAVRPDAAAAWIALAPGWGLPYGVIPYPFAGSRGLLAGKEGIASVQLPLPTGRWTSSIQGTVTASPDLEEARLEWTWTGTGQEALYTRRWFQRIQEDLRSAAMARKCVEVASNNDLIRFEDLLARNVTEGNAPDLFDRTKPFQLRCSTTLPLAGVAEGALLLPVAPYRELGANLRLDPPARRSLYQISYPVEHSSVIEVRAPEGFAPGELPKEVHAEAACCGSYVWTVTKTEIGFRVERKLTLPKLRIAASDAGRLREFMEKVREGDAGRVEFQRLP